MAFLYDGGMRPAIPQCEARRDDDDPAWVNAIANLSLALNEAAKYTYWRDANSDDVALYLIDRLSDLDSRSLSVVYLAITLLANASRQ